MEGFLQKRSVRLTLLVGVCLAALVAIYFLRDIFAPLIFSFIVAYTLDPLADALERKRFSRLAAVVTIFVAGALLLILVLAFAGYYVTQGVRGAYEGFAGERVVDEGTPGAIQAGGEWFIDRDGNGIRRVGYWEQLEGFLSSLEDSSDSSEVVRGIRDGLVDLRKQVIPEAEMDVTLQERVQGATKWILGGPVQRLLGRGEVSPGSAEAAAEGEEGPGLIAAAFTWVSWMLLCPLYVFFFLLEIDGIIARVPGYLPGRHREMIGRIARKIDRTLSAFFRGRLTICLVKGGLTAVGLLLLGVPFAIPIGLAAGFLALIPYVGIWFAVVPSLLLCWLEHQSWGFLAGVGVLFGALEGLEGFVLVPTFLGKEMGLHPLTVIVTLLIFGKVLGFIGVLLSVPLAAIAKILGEEFLLPLVEGFAAEEPEPPGGGAG